MNCELVIVARTDALSARLIDNNSDIIDQPFILGVSKLTGKELVTYVEAGVHAIKKTFNIEVRDKVVFLIFPRQITQIIFNKIFRCSKNGIKRPPKWDSEPHRALLKDLALSLTLIGINAGPKKAITRSMDVSICVWQEH